MIYLIGGAPRCGKTILGKRLAKRTGAWLLATDTVFELVAPTIPRDQVARRLPGSLLCGDDCHFGFELHRPADLLRGELRDSVTLWPGIRNLILADARHGNDLILEGVHLLPKLVRELRSVPSLRRKLKVVYLIKTDLPLIAKGLSENREGADYDWLAGCLDSRERIAAAARMIRVKGVYTQREARRLRLPVISTDVDFEGGLKKAAVKLGIDDSSSLV